MKTLIAFISRFAVLIVLVLIIAAAAIGTWLGGGRDVEDVDVDRAFQSTPRENRVGAPATGLDQNPGRPRTERPISQP